MEYEVVIGGEASLQTVIDGQTDVIFDLGGGQQINNQDKTVLPNIYSQSITADEGYTGLGTVTVLGMPIGELDTPVARKGTVTNNSVTVIPSVAVLDEGYISSGTLAGPGVTVRASELVSGNKEITANGTDIDVTNYATVSVNVASQPGLPLGIAEGSYNFNSLGLSWSGEAEESTE